MGVKEFNKLVKYSNVEASDIPISKFKGHWIAVDVNFVVVRYYFVARKALQYRSEEKDIEDQITALTYKFFLDFCDTFVKQGIRLYLCLDKKDDPRVADLKADVKNERWAQRDKPKPFAFRFVSDTIRNVFLKIIGKEIKGTRVMIAGDYGKEILAEGEALASQLEINKFAVAVYTGDSDAFAYGAKLVIKSHTQNTVSVIALVSILEALNINLAQLQDICILSGIDYNQRSMPILKAYQLIGTYGSIEKLPRNYRIEPSWELMRKILQSASTPFK